MLSGARGWASTGALSSWPEVQHSARFCLLLHNQNHPGAHSFEGTRGPEVSLQKTVERVDGEPSDGEAGLSRNTGMNLKGRRKVRQLLEGDSKIKDGSSLIFFSLLSFLVFFFLLFSGQGNSAYLCRWEVRIQQAELKLQQRIKDEAESRPREAPGLQKKVK